MKIVLIFPRANPRRGTKVKNYMVPPYGLQLLAALTPPHHEVILLDQFHRPVDPHLEADLIGISVWTAASGEAYRLANTFRARHIPVVLFGLETRLETATFTILTPYPNTGLYRRLQTEGRIFDYNWAHYDTTRVVFKPARMTVKQLEAGYFYAYRKFYGLDSILTRALRPGPGVLPRLALNLAYKRMEPLWRGFDLGLRPAWLRAMTHWYMRPPGVQQRVIRQMAQAQLTIERRQESG
jgi:radical SAM superfamily enzyme YgiQ (UPF0313 family)